MKKTLYSILTLLTFVTLVFSSNGFAQVGSPEYVVRVIYFLPSDRTPQPDINAKLDRLIKNTQLFYAEQMTAHGFGSKTFQFEADAAGKVVVHHLNGQFSDAHYNNDAWGKVWIEIEGQFDLSNNIYLAALDTSTEFIDNFACGVGGGGSLGGRVLIPASGGCFNVSVTAHELGHAFGLAHDFRTDGKWIPSAYIDIDDRMTISFCSAEWLDVHRYFEINQTLSAVEGLDPSLTDLLPFAASGTTHLWGVGALDGHESFTINQTAPGDALPTVEMLGPPSLAAAPNAIRLRFRVTDADGLHQVRLHTPQRGRSGEFIACKRVNGTSATVEFVTTELSPRSESVHLWVIDVHGNFISTWHEPHPIDVTSVLPPATAVSMPDAQLAAAIRQEIGNITTHSLLDLRDLDVSNLTGITNLTGLEYAYNLLYFSGGENEITDVSALANLTGLRDLRLYANQISDITPLANLKNFERLVLYSNQISDITPLANLMYLMELRLSDNQISDITALTGLKNLRDLRLGNNQISDITAIANLTNLARLILWGNQISDITPLANLKNLMELRLGNNQISDIAALTGLTNLTRLILWGNQISDITTLANLKNLMELRLSVNQVSDIRSLSSLTNLTTLHLSHNQIRNVGPLVDLINLEELYLAGNPIEDLSPLRILLAKNPNLKIDIDIPQLPPLAFRPNEIAPQTFTVGSTIQPFRLPVATSGTAPYIYTLTPLPEGLSFDAEARLLIGTPTRVGTTSATYTAIDAAGATASLTFTITVTRAPPANITFSPNVIADQTFVAGNAIQPLRLPVATGGTAPYTYTLSPLPNGLQFDGAERLLTGTPTSSGTTNTTYTARDAGGQSTSLTFTITVNTTGGTDDVPDTNLAAAIRRSLGVPADTQLTASLLLQLTTLDGYAQRITSLTGLEQATNLTTLDLGANQITDISAVASLTQLTHLYLDDNQITNVSPLVGLRNLRLLRLAGNPIQDTSPLATLIQQNPGLDLDVPPIPPQTGSVTFADPKLETAVRIALRMSASEVITREAMLGLVFLEAYDRRIESIQGLEHATNLIALDLGRNAIVNISPLSGLTKLQILFLDDNQIVDVSPLAGLTNLETLFLTGNPIESLAPISHLIDDIPVFRARLVQ